MPTEIPNQMGLPAYEQAPKELLNRLLDLSSSLCPEDEITPTQAWEYISAQTNFGRIELYKFQALAGKLREAVKCHGYLGSSACRQSLMLTAVTGLGRLWIERSSKVWCTMRS